MKKTTYIILICCGLFAVVWGWMELKKSQNTPSGRVLVITNNPVYAKNDNSIVDFFKSFYKKEEPKNLSVRKNLVTDRSQTDERNIYPVYRRLNRENSYRYTRIGETHQASAHIYTYRSGRKRYSRTSENETTLFLSFSNNRERNIAENKYIASAYAENHTPTTRFRAPNDNGYSPPDNPGGGGFPPPDNPGGGEFPPPDNPLPLGSGTGVLVGLLLIYVVGTSIRKTRKEKLSVL